MKPIAIIPARGGSKGLPGKNVRPFNGKPLIAWTIEAAHQSQLFDAVLLSTDDEEIRQTGLTWGAEAPFLRPAELSRDDTPGSAPLVHAVEWFIEHRSRTPPAVCLLQPTSPLRRSKHIVESWELFQSQNRPSLISVSRVDKHPAWMLQLAADSSLIPYTSPISSHGSRQELGELFAPNGAIYWSITARLLEARSVFIPPIGSYVMNRWDSVDIDSLEDFVAAERLAVA